MSTSSQYHVLFVDLCQVVKWYETSKTFEESVDRVIQMMDRLFRIPNKALLSDLFPYIWDLKGVLQLSSAFVKWMGTNFVSRILIWA